VVKKLVRVGDLTGVILDPAILRQVGIEMNSDVEISVEDRAIVIRPSRYASDDDARAAGRNVIRNRRRLLERLSQ
jgi:antitoxin component of MazEF toxin-antitoxin module